MIMGMKIDGSEKVRPILIGEVVTKPNYIEQEVKEYEGNAFIEALPPICDNEDVSEGLLFYPLVSERELILKKNVRFHLIRRLRNFNQPLPVHFDIERKISVLIRRGYLARNPTSKEFVGKLQALNEVREQKKSLDDEKVIKELNTYIRSTADCISVIGISGIGKTTAIEKLLLMYPQVIYHQEYHGNLLTRTQIVWLKIDSPYDGSLKTLCKSFFKAIDDVLGDSNYFRKYQSETVSTMMIRMAYLSTLYSIGLLVIDEIQFLVKSKSESDQILNFLVTLTNTIGLPLILVGTFKAIKMLDKELKSARRVCSEAGIVWGRMENDQGWEMFLESMWDHQYLKQKTPLSDELLEVMYDESQGITGIAVSLFILSQSRALFTKDEKITPELIRKTSKKDLFIIQKILKALREGDNEKLIQYEDVYISVDSILDSIEKDLSLHGVVSQLLQEKSQTERVLITNIQRNIILELTLMGLFDKLSEKDLENIAKKAVDGTTSEVNYQDLKKKAVKIAMELNDSKEISDQAKTRVRIEENDLRGLLELSLKSETHVYDLLVKKGYIKDPIVEFYGSLPRSICAIS